MMVGRRGEQCTVRREDSVSILLHNLHLPLPPQQRGTRCKGESGGRGKGGRGRAGARGKVGCAPPTRRPTSGPPTAVPPRHPRRPPQRARAGAPVVSAPWCGGDTHPPPRLWPGCSLHARSHHLAPPPCAPRLTPSPIADGLSSAVYPAAKITKLHPSPVLRVFLNGHAVVVVTAHFSHYPPRRL